MNISRNDVPRQLQGIPARIAVGLELPQAPTQRGPAGAAPMKRAILGTGPVGVPQMAPLTPPDLTCYLCRPSQTDRSGCRFPSSEPGWGESRS
jgi:hypothetical protein